MKITVTFDTLEEFQTYMGIQSPSKPAQEAAQGAQEAPKGTRAKKGFPTSTLFRLELHQFTFTSCLKNGKFVKKI